VVSNLSYFLHEANYVGNLTAGRGLIIIDEADMIEDSLLSFVEVHISKRRAHELGIEPPAKKTIESAWVDWAEYALDRVRTLRNSARKDSRELREIRHAKYLDRLVQNLQRLVEPATGLKGGGWVYTGYDKGDISFKPVRVDHLAADFLWRHGQRFLLMSATTISFQAMAETLGIE
jgi:hypothetical protein